MKVVVRKKEAGESIPLGISTEFIKLDAALKFANAVASGGEAKNRIADGAIRVNGQVCTMRGKKLYPGDTVEFGDQKFVICIHDPA